MKLTDYDAVSFDCYGTLIDWEAGLAAVLTDWAGRRGLDLLDAELLEAYGPREAAVQAETPGALYPDVLAESLRRVGVDLGAEVTQADAAAIARSVPDWPAFADSHDALVALGRRYRLIILSNVDRQSFAASQARLGVEFAGIVTAQDVGSYKPDRRNFDALAVEAHRLGIAPGRLLHTAQSLFHDHVPAKATGLPTVWINRRHDKVGWGATPAPSARVTPDWEFSSMADFAAAVTAEGADAE